MKDTSLRRLTSLAGIASVILYALGDALIADLPSINAPARTFAAYAAGHQTQLLMFVYVWGDGRAQSRLSHGPVKHLAP